MRRNGPRGATQPSVHTTGEPCSGTQQWKPIPAGPMAQRWPPDMVTTLALSSCPLTAEHPLLLPFHHVNFSQHPTDPPPGPLGYIKQYPTPSHPKQPPSRAVWHKQPPAMPPTTGIITPPCAETHRVPQTQFN